ncbi:MAG: hydantoinase/oxoprolinase family protein [Chloroflexi bacterium]|nr:hydantoinase/oxoprolinase family protein [Chloroflexota bacterium]
MIRLGIDIGGTFTDFVAIDSESGRAAVWKRLTTPGDPSQAVIAGVEELLGLYEAVPEAVSSVVHGTTLVANALIERKGARVGLLATAGHRDALEIGRELRYNVYDLFLERPTPLVPRALRLEVGGRLAADGRELRALDQDTLAAALDQFDAAGVEAVAISFMHAYVNPRHEKAAARIVRERLPGLPVSLSSHVAPVMHEYERASTTVANAYVQPLLSRYLAQLSGAFAQIVPRASFFVMLSSGGLASAAQAEALPVQLVESGPAAGALAACRYAQGTGLRDLVAFDMGGTTAKMCLIEDGAPERTQELEVARWARFKRGSGLPLLVPTMDLIEIGAGGGSIARVDKLGLLKVGPDSAGAQPGPACYGLGGAQPTVTDANLVLGYLDGSSFLGGRMCLDRAAAEQALARLGGPLGLDAIQLARGVHDLVNESMAIAARRHVTERGRDPRTHALVAFGGSGPVHAYGLARLLKITTVICPAAAGAASALGCLVAPARVELARSRLLELETLDWADVESMYAELEREARQVLAEARVTEDEVRLERAADVRYVGQGFEIAVTLPPRLDADQLTSAFQAHYERVFGRKLNNVPIEVVTWRLTATGAEGNVDLSSLAPGARADVTPKSRRPAHFAEAGGYVECSVYDRYSLPVGARLEGPAIVEEHESTAVFGPGSFAVVDAQRNLIVSLPRT